MYTYATTVVLLYGSYLIYRLCVWRLFLSPLRRIPGPPLGNPIFGQFLALMRAGISFPMHEWIKEYGPTIRLVGPLGFEYLLFTRPAALKQLYQQYTLNFPPHFRIRQLLKLAVGNGLLTVTGEEHRQMRKVINRVFSFSHLLGHMDTYYERTYSLIDLMSSEIGAAGERDEGTVYELDEILGRLTLDIICETSLGYKSDSIHNPDNELANAYQRLSRLLSDSHVAYIGLALFIPGMPRLLSSAVAYKYRRWWCKIPFLATFATLVESTHSIRGISARMFSERNTELDSGQQDTYDRRHDMMSILLRAQRDDLQWDKTAYRLSNEAMIDQILTFLGAGHETMVCCMLWTFWLLANHEADQSKLRMELKTVFAASKQPTYHQLKDLPWLDSILKESLRVKPPVPLSYLRSEKDCIVDGVFVPGGTTVAISLSLINQSEETWGPDAAEFRPSRWFKLPDNYDQDTSLFSFIMGPSACIGRNMALMEIKTMLAVLIHHFKFELAWPGQTVEPAVIFTMRPLGGLKLRVKKIEN